MSRIALLILTVFWLAPRSDAADPPPARCALTIELVEAKSGEPLPGWIQIRDSQSEVTPLPELICRGRGIEAPGPIQDWWVLAQPKAVDVPAAALTIAALSGLEYEGARQSVDLRNRRQATLQIPLVRFGQESCRGQLAGNTHFHLRKLGKTDVERYLDEVPRADGLKILFVTYLERAGDDLEYSSNKLSAADLLKLSGRGVRFGFGQEHRHNFGAYDEGYGHVLLLDLPRIVQPVSIGPGITKAGTDAPPLQAGINQAHQLGGRAIWAHNRRGLEDTPNFVTARLDATNLLDGNEHGSYDDPYYRYLNAGLRVPLSTGTDWFIDDFSRAYVATDAASTPGQWLAALSAGKSYVTNGPLLTFSVDDQKTGGTLELKQTGSVTVRARALGRGDFRELQLVKNGQTLRTSASHAQDNHFAAEMQCEIAMDKPCWLALRTPPRPAPHDPGKASFPRNEFGSPLFAHTSPIYLRMAGRDVFHHLAARQLLEQMHSDVETINKRGSFSSEAERQQVLNVYEEAGKILEQRLNQPSSDD